MLNNIVRYSKNEYKFNCRTVEYEHCINRYIAPNGFFVQFEMCSCVQYEYEYSISY